MSINDELLARVERWMEQYIGNNCRTALLPFEALKHIFTKFYDKNTGLLNIRIDTHTALDPAIRSTRPRKTLYENEIGELFRYLTIDEQVVILAHVDPFRELQTEDRWRQFLASYKIHTQHNYNRLLASALVNLHRLTIEKGLEMTTENDELWGLEQIADFMGRSIPTVMKWARQFNMPMAMVGGVTYASKKMLREWKQEQIKGSPYGNRNVSLADRGKGGIRLTEAEKRVAVAEKRKARARK